MLDSFRTNMRKVALGIVIVIAAIFALSGTGSMFPSNNSSATAIVVGGTDIPELDVVRAISNQRSRILSENNNIDPSIVSDELLRPGVVNQLISRQLLIESADDRGMAISDRRVNEFILANDGFLFYSSKDIQAQRLSSVSRETCWWSKLLGVFWIQLL